MEEIIEMPGMTEADLYEAAAAMDWAAAQANLVPNLGRGEFTITQFATRHNITRLRAVAALDLLVQNETLECGERLDPATHHRVRAYWRVK